MSEDIIDADEVDTDDEDPEDEVEDDEADSVDDDDVDAGGRCTVSECGPCACAQLEAGEWCSSGLGVGVIGWSSFWKSRCWLLSGEDTGCASSVSIGHSAGSE
jgi:hypothetical protein